MHPDPNGQPTGVHNTKISGHDVICHDEFHQGDAAEDVMGILELSGRTERMMVRKMDIHLMPLVMLLYVFSFLDRVNIGNARLYSLEADLGLKGQQYQTAVSLLFVTYVLFETPSNMVLKKLTPRVWIGFITCLWGVIATLTGLVNTYGQLIACRILLGIVEAGLFPGLTVYLTLFYTRLELGLRIGLLLVSAAVAGALGGLLAFAIGNLNGHDGLHGWRWIMIIEGLPTVVLGVAAYFFLPNNPETAYFFDEDDKALVYHRRASEYGMTQSAVEFSMKDSLKAFKDWKVWAMATGQFGMDAMLYGFSTFLPTIIKGIGSWKPAQVQLLTIPCYFFGAVCYLTAARLSDRFQRRALPVLIGAASSIIGYAILISNSPAAVHYFGCFLVAAGLYVCVGIPISWLPNNNPRYGKRTTASGIQLTVGNSAGIMAPFIYPTKQGPRYIKGHAITLCLVAYAFIVYGIMWTYFHHRNKAREEGKEDHKIAGMSDNEIDELGDESPRYRYMC